MPLSDFVRRDVTLWVTPATEGLRIEGLGRGIRFVLLVDNDAASEWWFAFVVEHPTPLVQHFMTEVDFQGIDLRPATATATPPTRPRLPALLVCFDGTLVDVVPIPPNLATMHGGDAMRIHQTLNQWARSHHQRLVAADGGGGDAVEGLPS